MPSHLTWDALWDAMKAKPEQWHHTTAEKPFMPVFNNDLAAIGLSSLPCASSTSDRANYLYYLPVLDRVGCRIHTVQVQSFTVRCTHSWFSLCCFRFLLLLLRDFVMQPIDIYPHGLTVPHEGCKVQRHIDHETPANGSRDKATCGNCGRSWCDLCDPCPSALCHYCHGMGSSEAPL